MTLSPQDGDSFLIDLMDSDEEASDSEDGDVDDEYMSSFPRPVTVKSSVELYSTYPCQLDMCSQWYKTLASTITMPLLTVDNQVSIPFQA